MIVNRSQSYTVKSPLHYWQSSSGTISTSMIDKAWPANKGDVADIRRVDPFNKKMHGYYYRELSHVRLAPVQSVLEYYQRPLWSSDPIKFWAKINVTGWYPTGGPAPSWLTTATSKRDELINRAIKGAMNEQVNLAQFIAELDKTAQLLSDSATRIASAAKAVRAGRFTQAARTLGIRKPRGASRNKTFANNWLKFSYGYGPIISDLAGFLQHVHTGGRSLKIISRSRIQRDLPFATSMLNTLVNQEAGAQHRLFVDVSHVMTDSVKEQVVLVFRPSSVFWDQASRLGFVNPGQLAWQSYPLTFIVDWFVNVGDWLAALNRALTLDYLTGSYTEFHRFTGESRPKFRFTDKKSTLVYTKEQHSTTPAIVEHILLKRVPLSEAEINVKIMLDVPVSVNQAITSVALVVQRLR